MGDAIKPSKRAVPDAQTVDVPQAVRPLLEQIGRLAEEEAVPVYAVGGCVRDWLLGIDRVTDLDVVVEGDGIAFAQRVARLLQATLQTHAQFGTATLERAQKRGEPMRIDVASCRKETYAEPAAYPNVTAGGLRDDLFRRDFTINAMAMAISPRQFGRLIDPFGGLKDLRARCLRILHPNSFVDDPSRLLRAVRFAQRYGVALDSQTSRCLRQAVAAGLLGKLNRGRLRKELERMVEEPDPVACLAQLGRWLQP